jgi:hypothetical protein
MMMKKSQTATEYLIILALVIVVALIVVAVMGGIPGIGKGLSKKATASFWKTTDLAIDSYAITKLGAVDLKIRNNLAQTITINSIKVGGVSLTSPGTISPGQTGSVIAAAGTLNCSGSFAYSVLINYTDSATNSNYIIDGDGHKLEGPCAN